MQLTSPSERLKTMNLFMVSKLCIPFDARIIFKESVGVGALACFKMIQCFHYSNYCITSSNERKSGESC